MKRDNAYFRRRLKQKNREDLLSAVERGEMTVYAASVEAGLRNKKDSNNAETLTNRWNRLNNLEKLKFVNSNNKELRRIILKLHENSGRQKNQPVGGEIPRQINPLVVICVQLKIHTRKQDSGKNNDRRSLPDLAHSV